MGKLIDAVKSHNLQEVQRLLAGEYKNSRLIDEELDGNGWNPLFMAVYYGFIDIIQALVKANANVNQANNNGDTPLYMATQRGHLAAIEALVKAKVEVNQANNNGSTPLYWAAQQGHAAAIEALVKAGADVNQADKDGVTPLHIAVQRGHATAIKALVKAGADVNQATKDGETPLHSAAFKGHAAAIEALVKAKADVNQATKDGATPLHRAAQMGHTAAIEALVKAGAVVNQVDTYGRTPLYSATQMGHTAAIEALVKANANVNQATKDGWTPLHIAVQRGHATAIKALVKAGADVNQANKNGATPLYIAAAYGHTAAIEALVKAKADVNQAMKNGTTPLHSAAQNGHIAAIEALLKAGADVNAKVTEGTDKGKTPLDIAKEGGHTEIVRLLETHLQHLEQLKVQKHQETERVRAEEAKQAENERLRLADIQKQQEERTRQEQLEARTREEEEKRRLEEHTSKNRALLNKQLDKTQKLLDAYRKTAEADQSYITDMEHFLKDTLTHYSEHPSALTTPAFEETLQNLEERQNKMRFVTVSLLQSLKSHLTEQKAENPSSNNNAIAKSSQEIEKEKQELHEIKIMVQSLQTTEKEKQTLNELNIKELKIQTQTVQDELKKELNTQKSQYAFLEQQQETLEKQIADLEKTLSQKSESEQQTIKKKVEKLQKTLSGVTKKQDILSNEYDRKEQKREALKRFKSHPNLLLYYRTVQIKLEEIFISFKAVAGGFVDPVEGNVAVAKSIVECLGDMASIAPVVGPAVEKFLKWTVSHALSKIDSARQNNTAANASGLVTLSEVKKYAENIARQLTERYSEQLQKLSTPHEEQAQINPVKKKIKKIKKAVLKSQHAPAAKQLAAFGVVWIIDHLYEAHKIETAKELDIVLLSVITEKKPADKISAFWQSITKALGIEGVRTKTGEVWHPADVYTLPGIRTEKNEYYGGNSVQPEIYGWRLGTIEEAKNLALEPVSAPIQQTPALENHNIIQSVAKNKEKIQQVDKVTQQLRVGLEKIEKTGQIVESARLTALEKELKKEKLEKEDMKKRLEQIETLFAAFQLSTGRSSSIPGNPLILTQLNNNQINQSVLSPATQSSFQRPQKQNKG